MGVSIKHCLLTVLVMRQFEDGPQKCCNKHKCIDYIEKMTIYGHFSIQRDYLTNTVFVLDLIKIVIKRFWSIFIIMTLMTHFRSRKGIKA